MIKLYLALLVILLAGSSFAGMRQAAVTESTTPLRLLCTYRLTFQPDSTDAGNLVQEDMLLYIGESFSKFQSLNRHLIDSLIVDIDSKGGVEYLQKNGFNAALLPRTRFNFAIYKDYPEGKTTVLDKIVNETYRYTESENLFHWKISPEKAVVAGYNCQKATTTFAGRAYEAWFTSEVPVREGPYKFQGLPGLIVKVGDTRNHYTFELIRLRQAGAPAALVFPDGQYIATTKQEFYRGLRDFQDNMAARLGVQTSEEASRRTREKAKKRNNPIELTL